MRKLLEAIRERPSNVVELAKATNLSRKTVYEHLSNMAKQSLVFQKGRKYFSATKGAAFLEKLKVLDMASQLDMTEEFSLPSNYSKRIYDFLKKNTRYGAWDPFLVDFDLSLLGKTFSEQTYREYSAKKINKARAKLAALALCKNLRISLFQEKDVRRALNLMDTDRKEIVTGVWKATGPLFDQGITKFAMLVTFDIDTVKDCIPEVTKEFYQETR